MKYLARASLVLVLAGGVACAGGSAGCGGADAAATGHDFTGAGGAAGTGGGGTAGVGGAAVVAPLRAVAVAVGATHSCALLVDHTVACWGDGSIGQLGDGLSGAGYHRAVAARVPGVEGVTALRAGDDTTCAALADRVLCWGDGAYGQLGDGTAIDGYFQASPVSVRDLASVVDLSVRGSAACAALPSGDVRCWGRNGPMAWLGFGSSECGPYTVQVNGDASLVSQPCEKAPHAVPGIGGAGAVVTSGTHTCAIAHAVGVSCWGADGFGQLGDGMSGPTAVDPAPGQVAELGKAVELALGTSHTCAVVGDQRSVVCWGDDSLGQLGLGSSGLDAYKTKPTGVPGLEQVADLDAAGDVTCAALADHSVRCWGDASSLVSPPGATGAVPTPKPVPRVSGVVQVRTSGEHACALRDDATVVCWGRNDSGQLGNGTMSLADDSFASVSSPQ